MTEQSQAAPQEGEPAPDFLMQGPRAHGVERVVEEVQEHPAHLLRHQDDRPERGVLRHPNRCECARHFAIQRQSIAAMKIGQVLSFLDVGLVPEEYREEFQRKLAELRDAAPKVSFKDMKKVLESEYGDKLEAGEKEKIEAAIKETESVLKSESKTEIDAKAQALAQAAQTLGQKMYAEQQAQAPTGQEQAQAEQSQGAKKDENVVDAEFTEVKDKKTGS